MEWFKHDGNAHKDPKLRLLRKRYGSEGMDLYWVVVEKICDGFGDNNISLTLEDSPELLAEDTGIDALKIDGILHYCVDLGLFTREVVSNRIQCLKLLKRMTPSMIRNPQVRKRVDEANQFHGTAAPGAHMVRTSAEQKESQSGSQSVINSEIGHQLPIACAMTDEKPKNVQLTQDHLKGRHGQGRVDGCPACYPQAEAVAG